MTQVLAYLWQHYSTMYEYNFKNVLASLLHDGNPAHAEPAISFAPSNFRKLQRFFSSAANIQEGTTQVQGHWRTFLSHV